MSLESARYTPEVDRLISEGSKAYALKDYDLASEKYGEACESYSEHHDGKEDGDLLLLYGKALFQSGVSKSGILGGIGANGVDTKAEDGEEQNGEEQNKDDDDKFQFYDAEPVEDVQKEGGDNGEEVKESGSGPGSEPGSEHDWEDVKDSENDQEGNQEEEQEESSFEIAWMTLDVARALFEDKLDKLKKPNFESPYIPNESSPTTEDEYIITLKKLSETYDILGEVSLEAENFPQSAQDLSKALKLRLELYPKSSSLVSESHYKLALALEFCLDDPESRTKAAEQIKLAIESTTERNSKEQDASKRKENDEMVLELQEKYDELKKDPQEDISQQQVDMIKGLLGVGGADAGTSVSASATLGALGASASGKSNSDQNPKPVNDLSNLVKKRKTTKGKEKDEKRAKK
ncbi:hypothetical protein KGF56_000832 [Candida oxycetoniae]|uniref:Tetratricopeptide SHNi-TPR domain-containing protein n=1 Tax=Candida oxycetoniae TaxID=497107 RepID=A0AAI9T020_9ASCO|nr:uncharacterized protein KGF56_000832 [Candida oxycetoniae]KAI3406351.2 hypothetical protein KGF56_000832 [Candida oxycetoniae]